MNLKRFEWEEDMEWRNEEMKYVSKSGEEKVMGLRDELIEGIESDGGIYMKKEYKKLKEEKIREMSGK